MSVMSALRSPGDSVCLKRLSALALSLSVKFKVSAAMEEFNVLCSQRKTASDMCEYGHQPHIYLMYSQKINLKRK